MLAGTARSTMLILVASHYIFPTMHTCGGRGTPRYRDFITQPFEEQASASSNTKTGPVNRAATREATVLRTRLGVTFIMGARCGKQSWLRSEDDRRQALADQGAQSCPYITRKNPQHSLCSPMYSVALEACNNLDRSRSTCVNRP